MKSTQQEEALRYFSSHARDWQDNVKASGEKNVNIIQQRNEYVIEIIKDRNATSIALDVGCGTGDLVCHMARGEICATGIDIAQDMIALAQDKARGERLEKARFECCSIFEFHSSEHEFDVISANGFIEYISQRQLDEFIQIAYKSLASNGSFIMGSRNQLFNLSSLNSFTHQELVAQNVDSLLRESIAWASGEGFEELEAASLQEPNTHHADTGISVATRFQYTPHQLVDMLNNRGFKAVEVYPIHIHGVPPAFKEEHPEIHAAISNLLQAYARKCSALVPFSSSFMLHAQKDE